MTEIQRTAPRSGIRAVDPKVTAHFHASAALYQRWSAEGHLHFGHWQPSMSILDRKAMLEEMVIQVVRRLEPRVADRLADLGCGYGSAAMLAARTFGVDVDAYTVVEEQVRIGKAKADAEGVSVALHQRDFRDTGLANGCIDGVYALESLCYGAGHGKRDVIHEAARILKPGGRIALVDGFLLKPANGWRRRMVRTVERGWALPCFPQRAAFIAAMEQAGFVDIRVRDLGWNVAPSAVHGPVLMIRCWLDRIGSGARLDELERAHLRSCMLGILLGTQRDLFRYLMITARKA
ncbi:MAG: methyltransferase domain-containing protein [Flavobacteriales bacterium]|nr:methyltransferase domain-containing protein [Flavobacteriales bacterium]